ATKGTIKDFYGFKANDDAEALRKAMKGLGTDEDTIMKILTSRSNDQRQQIAVAFKTLFGRDLVDDLKSELTGKLEKVIVALMTPSKLYDALELRNAMKVGLFMCGCKYTCMLKNVPAYLSTQGAGTDDDTLIRVMVSRSEIDMLDIRKEYRMHYGKSLLQAIKVKKK
ncbi:annexin A5-like, partial [Pyxicephalus adspersus]|uniref:annexin A5-like n=1 Tax=Pyxicephalus adspersus TaxID=30357 RepID=UPI003B59A2FB